MQTGYPGSRILSACSINLHNLPMPAQQEPHSTEQQPEQLGQKRPTPPGSGGTSSHHIGAYGSPKPPAPKPKCLSLNPIPPETASTLAATAPQPAAPPHRPHPPSRPAAAPVDLWVTLVPHEAVLLAVVEPVPSPACDDEAPKAVGLDPNQLIHALVAPGEQQLTAKLQGTPCKEDKHAPPCCMHTQAETVALGSDNGIRAYSAAGFL